MAQEGETGIVKLPDNDPEEIGWLLHYIYAKGDNTSSTQAHDNIDSPELGTDIDIPSLQDDENIPSLCVKLWTMGDYFEVETLAAKAVRELGAYLDDVLMEVCDNDNTLEKDVLGIHNLLGAVREAYKVALSTPVKRMLVAFFWACRTQLSQDEDIGIVSLLNDVPVFAKDVLLSLIRDNISEVSPWVPAEAGLVTKDKRPFCSHKLQCDGCKGNLADDASIRLYNPFDVDYSVHRFWCEACADDMYDRDEPPWRRAPGGGGGVEES